MTALPRTLPDNIAISRLADELLVLEAVSELLQRRRVLGSGHLDHLALARAYELLDSGWSLPPNFVSFPQPDARSHQTLIAITNAGPCHLRVTSLDANLLSGVLVHVEHIDRSDGSHQGAVEPYRIPDPRNAARVRFHIGNAAPCSIYVGAPFFEENFANGFLKATHSLAATCTAFFQMGYAECKINCAGLTVSQSTALMRAVAERTIRRPNKKQLLSAAFNLNTVLLDDTEGVAREYSTPAEIAKRSVGVVVSGGFDKITWDSASLSVPSSCVFELLSHRALVEATHLAHSNGLETYVSGGVTHRSVVHGVNAGLGGIGVGTSLHFVDDNGQVGALMKQSVKEVLRARDEASNSDLGRIAAMLAVADRKHAEKSDHPLVARRNDLLEALIYRKPRLITSLLTHSIR
ncbi:MULTISPECIES: hypothetical protein [Agrobacterium tumefaciens complex]|jgi:hypothetical protein|uniref:hypothetical protein n=1 Tax=Agrobacterium tumefaciens TaxID=358 RepID=UPI000FE27F55|nr:hypothetical protein [Agrobacterium tumefaciens]QAB01147.1 hypothetical protein DC439_25485 [Agrobacterium tumefaciens]